MVWPLARTQKKSKVRCWGRGWVVEQLLVSSLVSFGHGGTDSGSVCRFGVRQFFSSERVTSGAWSNKPSTWPVGRCRARRFCWQIREIPRDQNLFSLRYSWLRGQKDVRAACPGEERGSSAAYGQRPGFLVVSSFHIDKDWWGIHIRWPWFPPHKRFTKQSKHAGWTAHQCWTKWFMCWCFGSSKCSLFRSEGRTNIAKEKRM